MAIVSVLVAPLAALGGAWLNAHLARGATAAERSDTLRAETAAALGPMIGVLVDAEPNLVAYGELHEFDSPTAAVDGPYARRGRAREPLLVISYGHPDEHVRDLSFKLQAETELVPRSLDKAFGTRGTVDAEFPESARAAHGFAGKTAEELGRLLHPAR